MKETPILGYTVMEYGDTWYPGLDRRNMMRSENQLSALYSYVGMGVLEGWEVTTMDVPSNVSLELDNQILVERKALYEAYLGNPKSYLGQQYMRMGYPAKIHTSCKYSYTSEISMSSMLPGVLLTPPAESWELGDRILLAGQSDSKENGIYVVDAIINSTFKLVRSEDLNEDSDIELPQRVYAEDTKQFFVLSIPSEYTNYSINATPLTWTANDFMQSVKWSQCIRVTEGKGIIGSYKAETTRTSYLSIPSVKTYYVWAEAGQSIAQDAKANIVVPNPPDDEYNLVKSATYLATIETVADDDGSPKVYQIVYEEQRMPLKSLKGLSDLALRKYFLRHIHARSASEAWHPTKVNLATELILDTRPLTPTSSTIFVPIRNGRDFGWNPNSYGIPEVRINDILLMPEEYVLSVSQSIAYLYLKNNLPPSMKVQIILPLFRQDTRLLATMAGNSLTSDPAYLADPKGTPPPGWEGDYNPMEHPAPWNPNDYNEPLVRIRHPETGELQIIQPYQYSLEPEVGAIQFDDSTFSDPDLSEYLGGTLEVVLTTLGEEITGRLPGSRLRDIDASQFRKGTLNEKRINNLDHIGQVRYKEAAAFKPSTKIYASGDGYTYYPELANVPPPPSPTLQPLALIANGGLPKGIYYVTVAAVAANGAMSIASNEREISLINDNQAIEATWSSAVGAVKYRIFFTALASGVGYKYFETTATSYIISNAFAPDDIAPNSKIAIEKPLQYDSDIICIERTENRISGFQYLIGTKRGLYCTNDFVNFVKQDTWNQDWGQVVQIMDDVLPMRPYYGFVKEFNRFKTTYVLAVDSNASPSDDTSGIREGRIFYTKDAGRSWQKLRMPIKNGEPLKATCFWVSTDVRQYGETGSLVKFRYSSRLYIGTRDGLYTATVNEEAPDNWGWGTTAVSEGVVNAVVEIGTPNETFTSAGFGSGVYDINYDRTVYAATPEGLYVGDAIFRTGVNDEVRGLMWIRQGTNNANLNDLVWFTKTTSHITHTAKYHRTVSDVSGLATTTQIRWTHPLVDWVNAIDASANKYQFDKVVATSGEIDLRPGFCPARVDGVFIDPDMVILVKNQSNWNANGLYQIASGGSGTGENDDRTWERVQGHEDANDLPENKWILVTYGAVNSGTSWYVYHEKDPQGNSSPSLPHRWRLLHARLTTIISTDVNDPNHYISAKQLTQAAYGLCSRHAPAILSDAFDSRLPSVQSYANTWNYATKKQPKSWIYYGGIYYIGSTRGMWRSILDTTTTPSTISGWTRPVKTVPQNILPTIFNLSTGSGVLAEIKSEDNDPNVWFDYDEQAINFKAKQELWHNFVAEKDYNVYYVESWKPGGDVLVYVNGSALPGNRYVLNPSKGIIKFLNPVNLPPTAKVEFTLVRLGAYIKNVGVNAHEELEDSVPVVQNQVVSTLTRDFPYRDGFNSIDTDELYVSNIDNFPTNITQVELRTYIRDQLGNLQMKKLVLPVELEVTVDGSSIIKRLVVTSYDNANTVTFLRDRTDVRLIRLQRVPGIQDKIAKNRSGQLYHFNSIAGLNNIQLMLSLLKNQTVNNNGKFLNDFYGKPVIGSRFDRGPKKAIMYVDGEGFDSVTSSSTLFIGHAPTADDSPAVPRAVYSLRVNSQNNVYAGTDKGIWRLDANGWKKESELNQASRTYFLGEINKRNLDNSTSGILSVGTDQGLFNKVGNAWLENPLYPQIVFDYKGGASWGKDRACEAYAKSDGLAFILHDTVKNNMLRTDYFLGGVKIYGLFHGQFYRPQNQSDGTTKLLNIDALYLATELGVYAITAGFTPNRPNSILVGRNMFSPELDAFEVSPGVQGKVYKIFLGPSGSKPPMFLLTNNGIYRIMNWRAADPDPSQFNGALPFHVHIHALPGVSCYSNATLSETVNSATRNIMFVGTEKGVYRSFNEGHTWDPCERLDSQNLTIYTLATLNVGLDKWLIAGTERGLYYSKDFGSTWSKGEFNSLTGETNPFSPEITPNIAFNKGYLAQTFSTDTTPVLVSKLSAYVGPRVIHNSKTEQASLTNVLQLGLFNVNGEGEPNLNSAVIPFESQKTLKWCASGSTGPSDITLVTLNGNAMTDNAEGDTSTYIEVRRTTTSACSTAIYDLGSEQDVAKFSLAVYYTQTLSLELAYSNTGGENDWTDITVNVSLPDHQTNGQWYVFDYELDSTANARFFRIYLRDNRNLVDTPGNPVPDSVLRVGDFRLYSSVGAHIADMEITGNDVRYPAFWTRQLSNPVALDPETQYALVGREVAPQAGSTGLFYWASSNKINPVTGGGAQKREDDLSWTDVEDKDFFFKVFLTAPTEATFTAVNVGKLSDTDGTEDVGFNHGNFAGLVVGTDGRLTTDPKLAVALLVDDTHSVIWSDPISTSNNRQGLRNSKIPSLMSDLVSRSVAVVNSVTKYGTYADVWVYANSIRQRTPSGFTNDINTIVQNTNTYLNRGEKSTLIEAANIAFTGLSPQSLVDTVGTSAGRIQAVIDYLKARSLFRLQDVQRWFDSQTIRSQWGGQESTIKNYADVSGYVVQKWASSFVPLALLITDGDNVGDEDARNLIIAAKSGWDDNGFPVNSFGLGTSHSQNILRQLSDETGGKHYFIANSATDWDSAKNSLLHGGENNLFGGSWSRAFDFDSKTWVKNVNCQCEIPTGSQTEIFVRYTLDRTNWSEWVNILDVTQDGTSVTQDGTTYTASYEIEDEIYGIEYRANLRDGWNTSLSARIQPSVLYLYHTEVSPAIKYLLTPAQDTDGMIFEYLLSATTTVPRSSRLNWGIVRGNSIDFADFESIFLERQGCLSNRQQSVSFTPEILYYGDLLGGSTSPVIYFNYTGMKTLALDPNNAFVYQVYNAPVGKPHDDILQWDDDYDSVVVRVNEVILPRWTVPDPEDPTDYSRGSGEMNYNIDGARGQIIFTGGLRSTDLVRAYIKRNSRLLDTDGEIAITKDGRTYYSVNGRWSHDSTAIVLINNEVFKGAYWVNPEEGSITFAKERETIYSPPNQIPDIVRICIVPSNKFRVGVEIKNYTDEEVSLENFGLFYTSLRKSHRLSEYQYNTLPYLLSDPQLILSDVYSPDDDVITTASVHNRLAVNYRFYSPQGNTESGTIIKWWVKRSGTSEEDYDEVIPDEEDGFFYKVEGYDGRTVQRSEDLGIGQDKPFQPGDIVFVTVMPNDEPSLNSNVRESERQIWQTNRVLLSSEPLPFITGTPDYVGSYRLDGHLAVPRGTGIQALCTQSGTPDQKRIEWYKVGTAIALQVDTTTSTLDPTKVQIGDSIYYRVIPYNGTVYGIPVVTEVAYVTN
jgi:hypothetical protein